MICVLNFGNQENKQECHKNVTQLMITKLDKDEKINIT